MQANGGDSDQTPRSATSELYLHCLPMPQKKNTRRILVNVRELNHNQLPGMSVVIPAVVRNVTPVFSCLFTTFPLVITCI